METIIKSNPNVIQLREIGQLCGMDILLEFLQSRFTEIINNTYSVLKELNWSPTGVASIDEIIKGLDVMKSETIDLTNNGITFTMIKVIMKYLLFYPKINTLILSDNILLNDGLEIITVALNKSLGKQLISLYLRHNYISEYGMYLLCYSLQSGECPMLKELDISCIYIHIYYYIFSLSFSFSFCFLSITIIYIYNR